MYENLKNNNLHAEQQYRFCKLHSIEYAAVKLTDYSSEQMKSGKIVKYHVTSISIVLRLLTLSFDVLLYKLKIYGFAGTELIYLKDYSENKKQYVKYKTYQSEMIDISTGVPQ